MSKLELSFYVLVFLASVICFGILIKMADACEKRGGILVRGMYKPVCVGAKWQRDTECKNNQGFAATECKWGSE